MMMSKWPNAASLALTAVLVSSHAFAGVIVENTAGTVSSASSSFVGQSFTMPSSGGPWNDITFNFFSNVPATTPVAFGTAFLLDQVYLGTPSSLSSATPGFLAESTGITGGMYDFAAALTLDPGVTYFVYENAAISIHAITGGNSFAGGNAYAAFTAIDDFVPQLVATNFAVSGTVVPEPSALLMLVSGLLGFGFLGLYRKNG
jgi:PEP-CTERM motif